MKQISVRVSGSDDVVYHNDKPHRLENIAFHRDEVHNCQMVMYATISPLIKGLDLDTVQLKSDVDDMLSQQFEDMWYCDYCGGDIPDSRVDVGEICCSLECDLLNGTA